MPMYKVKLYRFTSEMVDVEVDAATDDEARDKAMSQIGEADLDWDAYMREYNAEIRDAGPQHAG